MREKGIVIYLCAPVAALVGRLEAFPEEGQRPALTSRPLSEEVSEVLAEAFFNGNNTCFTRIGRSGWHSSSFFYVRAISIDGG